MRLMNQNMIKILFIYIPIQDHWNNSAGRCLTENWFVCPSFQLNINIYLYTRAENMCIVFLPYQSCLRCEMISSYLFPYIHSRRSAPPISNVSTFFQRLHSNQDHQRTRFLWIRWTNVFLMRSGLMRPIFFPERKTISSTPAPLDPFWTAQSRFSQLQFMRLFLGLAVCTPKTPVSPICVFLRDRFVCCFWQRAQKFPIPMKDNHVLANMFHLSGVILSDESFLETVLTILSLKKRLKLSSEGHFRLNGTMTHYR